MKEEGFTLIEILVAITIAGIILGSIFTFFDLGFSSWQRSDSNDNYQQQQRVIEALLRKDMQGIFISAIYKDNKFEGYYDQVEWLILGKDSLRKVSYTFDAYQNQLIRKVTDFESNEVITEMSFFTETELRQIEFAFYDPKDEYWKDSWSYQKDRRLPIALNLKIEAKDRELPPVVINLYPGRKY